MKPVCVPCQRFFRMKKSGFYFTEAMPAPGSQDGPRREPGFVHTPRPLPGTAEPDKWQPYKIWSGDRWECEGCGASIISGFGQQAISEHYQEDFAHYMKTLKADQLQVNDC